MQQLFCRIFSRSLAKVTVGFLCLLYAWGCLPAWAQVQLDTLADPYVDETPLVNPNWSQRFQIRGYMQVRYNRLLETNPALQCEQCDRSWGEGGGFFIRRARIIFLGQISKRVYFYIQPDLASNVSANQMHYLQLRDAYFDVGLNDANSLRIRIGQSKIPYGFENMQSSQNRLPLDRNDAINSAIANERDLGVMLYWAPYHIRERFTKLVRQGLKGSGDYGVLALGAYNGQTANRPEANEQPHIAARATYPFLIGKQIIEPSVQGYKGQYVLIPSQVRAGVQTTDNLAYTDNRVAATFVLYPQPFGLFAEYNMGTGPEYDPATNAITQQDLKGGYATLTWLLKHKEQIIMPFVRVQTYEGGKKHETDARSHTVNELEVGVEWQPSLTFELTAQYTLSERRFEDSLLQNNVQRGGLLRLQAQLNF